MPIYLVGGFVRDLILGVDNLDLDIVVVGNGISFAEDLTRHLKVKLIRHRRFGTATVILKPRLKIDITSARKEFYPRPAHLPVVCEGTLKDDLFRRDFTINAMAISITGGNFGRLIDFFAGRDDLFKKKIRILHNLSFIDDPTRILRAVRFEKRYNFRIESETLANLKEAVKLKMLEKVEPQRIRDDLILILKEKHPVRQIMRLKELVGFAFINPHLSVSQKTYRFLRFAERQISWFEKRYPQRRQLDAWLIYFMGLTDSLKPNAVKELCRRFAFRKGEEKRLLSCKKINHRFIRELSQKNTRPSRIFTLFEPLSYEAILFLKTKYKNPSLHKHIEDFFEVYNGMRIYIGGDELYRLGFEPGPNYQKVFAKVLKAKLDGLVKTKEEELALIKKFIKFK